MCIRDRVATGISDGPEIVFAPPRASSAPCTAVVNWFPDASAIVKFPVEDS